MRVGGCGGEKRGEKINKNVIQKSRREREKTVGEDEEQKEEVYDKTTWDHGNE